MLWLILGGLGAGRSSWAASALSSGRRSTTIKALIAWIVALGGLEPGGLAADQRVAAPWPLSGLVMFGPLIWQRWRAAHGAGKTPGANTRQDRTAADAASSGAMTVDEAWQVLGLQPGADDHECDPRGASPPDARCASGQWRIGLAGGAHQPGPRHLAIAERPSGQRLKTNLSQCLCIGSTHFAALPSPWRSSGCPTAARMAARCPPKDHRS